MRFTIILSLLLPINGLLSSVSIKRYSREINGNKVKVYEPKYLDKKNTHSLLFFTGGNALITSEVYTDFLSTLANENFSVYVAPSNLDSVDDVIDTLSDEYLDVTNIGHSSGAVNVVQSANKNKLIKRSILLDPVDSDKLFKSFNFQPNLPFFAKNNNKLGFKYLKDLLVINAKKSYEWKLMPLTIPFVPAFKMEVDEVTKDDVNVDFVEAENFGHSDILNPFWGEIMHNTISKGSDDRNEEVIDKYHFWLAKTIKNFINNNNLLDNPDPDTLSPSDYETENIELQ